MRQTGRTTQMLLRAATFVSDHWEREIMVVIIAHNEMFADALQRRFTNILPGFSKQQRGLLLYGNIRVAFMGRDRFNHQERKVYPNEKTFFDHYSAGR